ncbi:hypothetical protein N7507_007868 [Penicillium longicatenatum]|nr:hypothetical protein N7507_007868 [Penicillium longicatenatum]
MAQSKKRRLSPASESEKERKKQFIHENKLSFEGPINSTKWPQCHSALFSAIRKIEDVKYNQYVQHFQSTRPLSSQKSETIDKAEYLVSAAKQCRAEETNEDTWRDKTENHLLSTFSNTMECQKCKLLRWRWLSERRVEEETQSTLALCKCIGNSLHGDRAASHHLFAEKRGPGFVDRSAAGIRVQYPDRVIGFNNSPSLAAALQRHPDLSPSPVKDARNILFPFLVLEAKAENNSCFSSVERQTALPIKRLVDVQKSLRETCKGLPDTALVWFLAFRGEEWIVYACVPDGNETRIIDLWHGCILRDDCALQLCLIVDLICDWAWHTLHRDILRLLSVEETTISDNVSAPENDQDLTQASKLETVIRDTGEICFKFRHLTLPESNSELTELLKLPSSGNEDVSRNATNLLDSFNVNRPMLLPQSFISQLEMSWIGASNKSPLLNGDELVFAHISFRSYFPPSDYHTVREISCVTASYGVIRTLKRLSGKGYSVSSRRPDISNVRETILSLATGPGQDFIRAAVRDSRLTLGISPPICIPDTGPLSSEWRQHYDLDEDVSNLWNNMESCSPGNPLLLALHRSRKLRKMSIANESSNKIIRALLGGGKKSFHTTPARLLKQSYPRYCLAVFDGCDLDNRLGLGQKLLRLIMDGKLLEGKTSKPMTFQDRQILHDWATRLQGKSDLLA